MSSPADVAELLARLGKVRSPMERMRLLARAWRQIRALSADERAVLADAVGLPGAERFLERVAGRKIPVGDLVRSLADASDDDPGALRGVLRSIGDDDGRRSLVRRGRDAIANALAPKTEPAAGEPERLAEIPPELFVKSEPDPEPEPEPDLDLEPDVDREPERTADAEPEPEPTPLVTAAPVAAVPPVAAAPDRVRPVEAPALEAVTDGPVWKPSESERLREFESIGPSWGRRRDVMRRIAAGELRTVADLEPFLDRIDGAADRRWCTLALVEHGGLSRDDLEGLASETSDAVVRRRAARHADAAAG